jgi:periplasmic protein TonB
MTNQERRKKQVTAAFTTIAINVVVFMLLLFSAAWKNAGSGEGQYPGIEVNLGYDDQGSGNIQPDEPIGNENATDDENSPSEPNQETTPDQSSTTTAEDQGEAKVQTNTVTDPNSDVEIKEEKKEEKPVEKVVEKKPIEKPVEKKVEEKPVVDTKAVYQSKKNTNASTTGDGDGKQGTTGSEGDDKGKAGDKGVKGGTIDGGAYKGDPGGGDGGTLDIDGWQWDEIPRPAIPENELRGRVVFKIKVNDNGEIIGYEKESGAVSPAAERACVTEIQKLTFTKKPGAKVPPISVGRITFVISDK